MADTTIRLDDTLASDDAATLDAEDDSERMSYSAAALFALAGAAGLYAWNRSRRRKTKQQQDSADAEPQETNRELTEAEALDEIFASGAWEAELVLSEQETVDEFAAAPAIENGGAAQLAHRS